MKSNWKLSITAFLCMTIGFAVWAQGPGPGNLRLGPANTSGWALMTVQERTEHRNKVLSMKTFEECKAYMEQHHTQMAERAKEKGRAAPPQARRDACAWLKG